MHFFLKIKILISHILDLNFLFFLLFFFQKFWAKYYNQIPVLLKKTFFWKFWPKWFEEIPFLYKKSAVFLLTQKVGRVFADGR
jgi:hypothetical protein